MSRKFVLVLGSLVLLFCLMNMKSSLVEVKAANGYPVHNLNTGLNYTSIQEAINASETLDEHSLFVDKGIYYEHVVVNKTVSLIGEKATETIIDGETGGVEIRANNVTIRDFTIRNSNQALDWSSNNLISISNFNGTLIQGNVITSPAGKTAGIVVMNSYGNIISGNNITANYNEGIRLWHSSNNTISGNNITGNSIDLDESSYNNTLTENSVSLTHIGCIGSFNIISRNSVTNSSHIGGAIALYESSNTISENIIINNEWGVTLYGYGHNISGNTISASTYDGILVYSNDSRIYSNNITDNGQAGITIEISCSNNEFYHNNLINNTRNVRTVNILGKPPMHNTWDNGYPSGGNYWSDYTGVDANGDDIGDTPYVIDGNNKDRYPLMTQFVTAVQVGVKAGDWIKYDYTVTGWPTGTPYPEWLKVEFLSIDGTNATVRVTMHMSNGTEQNATVPVDVVAGGQVLGLSGFVIPANLTTGDIIFMSGYGNVTISGETTKTYAGASRKVVYASFSQYGTQLTYYWDKWTGVMAEASVTSGTMTGTGKATETNMWQAAPSGLPIDPIYLYVLAASVIIIAVGASTFIVRRRKRQPKDESPQT